jgi:hypothetical protein
VVVAGGYDPAWHHLPHSIDNPHRPYIGGGERSLYELAVGAAALGYDVELRGGINQPILKELTDAAGASPRSDLPPRRPGIGDTVILAEGADPEWIVPVVLSGARLVLHLLGPPGLSGWSFLSTWAGSREPTTVPLDAVGRPETFRAIDALGIAMWTNAHGMAAAGDRAGVEVSWLGTGTPVPFPDAPPKEYDLAIVENNRWRPAAEAVAARVGDASVLRVGPVPWTYSLSAALAPARLLVWPSRLEGMSRIAREGRAVGTVPVFLDTNPFVTREDYGDGVVLCSSEEEMVSSIEQLLSDSSTIDKLAGEAATGARQQAAWKPFLERLDHVLSTLPDDPAAQAKEHIGEMLSRHDEEVRSQADAELAHLRSEVTAHRRRFSVRTADRLADNRYLGAIMRRGPWRRDPPSGSLPTP